MMQLEWVTGKGESKKLAESTGGGTVASVEGVIETERYVKNGKKEGFWRRDRRQMRYRCGLVRGERRDLKLHLVTNRRIERQATGVEVSSESNL